VSDDVAIVAGIHTSVHAAKIVKDVISSWVGAMPQQFRIEVQRKLWCIFKLAFHAMETSDDDGVNLFLCNGWKGSDATSLSIYWSIPLRTIDCGILGNSSHSNLLVSYLLLFVFFTIIKYTNALTKIELN